MNLNNDINKNWIIIALLLICAGLIQIISNKEKRYKESIKPQVIVEEIIDYDILCQTYEITCLYVNDYIKKYAPDSKINAEVLVDECLENNIDIRLPLAQGRLESHFGTRGKARNSNSVWNIGAWDDGQIRVTYNDPNESIKPYLKRLTSTYLVDGMTEEKLLNNFVNKNGHRYASNKNYEKQLAIIYYNIPQELYENYEQCRELNNKLG